MKTVNADPNNRSVGGAQHTPGPWRFSSHPYDGNYMRIHCSSDPSGGDSLRGYCGEANARLIAAAPDLLEALKLCEGNISSLLASKHPKVFGEWLYVVRAAIAKATGEQL